MIVRKYTDINLKEARPHNIKEVQDFSCLYNDYRAHKNMLSIIYESMTKKLFSGHINQNIKILHCDNLTFLPILSIVTIQEKTKGLQLGGKLRRWPALAQRFIVIINRNIVHNNSCILYTSKCELMNETLNKGAKMHATVATFVNN